MIPSTLTGVLLLLAGLAPGHLYLRCYETRAAREPRAGVREAAEVAALGAFFTVVGIVVSLGVAQFSTWFYPLGGLLMGRSYLPGHPWAAIASLALVLTLSAGGCAAAGALAGRRRGGGELRTGMGTPWTDVLSEVRNTHTRPYAAIETCDGRVIEGFILSVAADQPAESSDVSLRAPIMLTPAGRPRRPIASSYVIVPGKQIVAVSVLLVDLAGDLVSVAGGADHTDGT